MDRLYFATRPTVIAENVVTDVDLELVASWDHRVKRETRQMDQGTVASAGQAATRARAIVIIGGVVGGVPCASRVRRQDERIRIVTLERGPYVSFANCDLPYYTSGVIDNEVALLIADAASFRERFNAGV